MSGRATLRAVVLASGALLGPGAVAAHAADLKPMSSVALRGVIERVVPDSERAGGHEVTAQFATAKTSYSQPGEGATLAANGEVELGVAMMSEVAPVAGVQALPLKPDDPGSFIVFVGAVASGAKDPDASRAWLAFMQSPAVQEVFRSQGMTKP